MKRSIALILVLVMVMAMLPLMTQTSVNAVEKKETKRVIGIVFDNSGSMYDNRFTTPELNYRWCQATYAIEVFAAMLNSGDELRIYPMHGIEVQGNYYSMDTPLVIKGPNDSCLVREIYTPSPGGTPGSTIEAAFEDLSKASGFAEKHLIVLTDGIMEEMATGGYYDENKLPWIYNLLDKCSSELNQVMYLGMGAQAIELTARLSNQYYSLAKNSADVLNELSAMCNRIFGRHILNCDPEQLSFDVSMSKIIIFAQGEGVTGATIDGLGDPASVAPMQYSEKGAGSGRDTNVDKSLQGVIVTYEGSYSAGDYSVSYSGDADSVSVYYEPFVDIEAKFVDAEGNEIDPTDTLYEGEYAVEFCVVDGITGQPVNSDLLGNVDFTVNLTKNGTTETTSISGKNGSVPITLEYGDTLDAEFIARYLDGYQIYKTGEDFGWPSFGITIQPQPAKALEIAMDVPSQTFSLSRLEDEAVIGIKLFYDGVQLTGDALNAVADSVNVQLTGGNAKYEVTRTNDGYQVKLFYNNSPADTQAGEYTLSVSAAYTNEDDQTAECSTSCTFRLEDDAGQFQAELVMEQDYYVASTIEKGKPIYVNLTCGGKPLTAEQFQATKVEIDMGTLPCTITADEANSRYVIVLEAGEGLTNGRHEIRVSAEGYDEFGRTNSRSCEGKLSVRPYPQWVPWLIGFLIALGIFLLVIMILNIKVLPKRIDSGRFTFLVGGKRVEGEPEVDYSRKGKSLTIAPPYYTVEPAASGCSITLELVPVSPLRKRSAERAIGIRGVVIGDESNTTRVKFGGTTMVKNPDGVFVRMGTTNQTEVEENVDSGANVCVFAEIRGARNRKLQVSVETCLEFR